MKVIYDVGANVGQDVEYYLMKADKVVTIDADPNALEELKSRFKAQCLSGRLAVVHAAIHSNGGTVPFFVNRKSSILSRLHAGPELWEYYGEVCSPDAFEEIRVPTAKLSDIIHEHGDPHFIKIDVEGADELATQDLFEAQIRPKFISVEFSFSYVCACYLYLMGYRDFQVIDQALHESNFNQHKITTLDGSATTYDFPYHSSGPFGDDLPGGWMDFETLCFILSSHKLREKGHWFDIHAKLSELRVTSLLTTVFGIPAGSL